MHPPTAKLLIATGVWLFGYKPWAWRLAPALAGILLAPLFFLLARRVLATERAALLATLLLLMDGVYLVQSRIAMTNIFAVLFQLPSALLAAASRDAADELRLRDMAALGVALGPRALHALDEPLGLGLPGARAPRAAQAAAPSGRASWPSARSPSCCCRPPSTC